MSDEKTPFRVGKRSPSVLDTVPERVADRPGDNFRSEDLVGMTFNMPRSWHRRFKMTAVQEGINMRELLFQCFDEWEKRRGR